MDELRSLTQLLITFGAGGFLVWFFLSDPSRLLKAWSLLARGLYLVTKRWKKQNLSTAIEAHVNSALNQIAKEAPSAFPTSFRIKWIDTTEQHALLEDGSVVVRVRDDVDPGKSAAAATVLFLQTGLIPQSRPYVERRLLQAIDLVLAFRFLETSPFPTALRHLSENFLDPALEDPRVAALYETADSIDRSGLLTRIVLREFSGIHARLKGVRPTAVLRKETESFLDFARRVIFRSTPVPLRYFGRIFRATVALIANPDVYEASGVALYKRNFQRDIDAGIQVIYLLARGARNLGIARAVAQWAAQDGLISGSIPDNYAQPDDKGGLVPAECIVCFSARVGRTVQLNPTEEVLIAISQEIPESLTGDIEVVSIAREPSLVSKILVRSDRVTDPIRLCLGERNARLRAMQAALNSTEVIDFIEWAPDIRRNVASSLVPLRNDDIASIWIAPDSLSAKVYVKSTEAAHRAVGTDGVNLRIAESLLGIHIDLETKDSSIPPEDELLEILRYRVPEIEDGRIQVVRLQRHVGRASKVAVSSAELPDPVRRCIGQGATMAQAISHDLNGEHVTFVEWRTNNLADVIRDALHPARPQDITQVQVDPTATTANVSIRGAKAMRLAIGRDGDNVRLAERLCGIKINLRQIGSGG